MGDPAGAVHRLRLGEVTGVFLALHMLDDGGARPRVFGDVDGASADHGAAGSAGAQFSESHSYRHSDAPYLVAVDAAPSLPKDWRNVHPAPATNDEDWVERKRVNHDGGWICPSNGPIGHFRPIEEQGGWRRERGGALRGPTVARPQLRFGMRFGASSNRLRSGERQICHVWALNWGQNFLVYLSDLFCRFVARIGALGLRPTYSRTTRGRLLGFAGGRGLRV